MDATFTPFTPSPALAAQVIDALGSPDNTLRDVAADFSTTLEALTLWMTRPDIAARLDAIQSAVTRRTRLMATNFLPGVVRLLNSIIDHYHEDEHEREPQPLAPEPRRHRENARKAAALLIRLAKLTGTPSPREHPNPAAPPPLRGTALGGTALQSGAPPIASAPSSPSPAALGLPNLVAWASSPCPSHRSVPASFAKGFCIRAAPSFYQSTGHPIDWHYQPAMMLVSHLNSSPISEAVLPRALPQRAHSQRAPPTIDADVRGSRGGCGRW
ncbi:MAG: hypothetical protein WC718_15310 [Phycisphaerales bacterium]|jgi:hypothetical protein